MLVSTFHDAQIGDAAVREMFAEGSPVSAWFGVQVATSDAAAPQAVARSGRSIWVDSLEIRYRFDFRTGRWSDDAKLVGRRIFDDGTAGARPSTISYGSGAEVMPEWLARVVAQNRPSFILPDIVVNA